MPLINGQKMACEPCIRGHRSTKCTHANERLMVPVRKPGRPLSSCPHPSSRPCSCAAVTAAIPRKQKCRCGTSSPVATDNKSEKDASTSSGATPPSPSKFGSSSFRVQKQGAKAGPSRKQSVDIAGLQRMDANQLNILQPYNGVNAQQMNAANGPSTPMSDMSLYGSMNMTPSEGSFGAEAGMYPVFAYTMGPSMMPHGQLRSSVNGQNGASANGGTIKSEGETPKSCCGGSSGVKSRSDTPSAPTIPAIAAPNANSTGGGERESKSCCSSTPTPAAQHQKPATIMPPPPGIPFPPNGVIMQPFPQTMAMASGMYPFYAQPNVFNYPPHYGSYLQPLQPEQWRQLMAAAMTFGQPGGGQVFGMAGPVPMQQPPQTPNGSSWTSHQCTCGDSCQCVGCAAHPYNEATQNYVRSAWSSMMEEGQKSHAQANSNGSRLDGRPNGGHGTNGEMEESAKTSSNGTTTPVKTNGDGTWSPVAPQTPSDAASGVSEEQALSASDFFFVSYPFGDTCAGETSSCLCGDDCQCIGCTIHNNADLASNNNDTAA